MSNYNEEDIAVYLDKNSIRSNLTEWSNLITELSIKENQLLNLKDEIFDKEQWIIENTDFKEIYGKNNVDVRRKHLQKFMKTEYANRKNLEISIDYIKRRISFLKSLIRVKTVLMEVKE